MAKGISMIAKHPLAGRSPAAGEGLPTNGELAPVEDLAAGFGISPAIVAGIRRHKGWADGKMVSAEEFSQAVADFEERPMGGN